MKAVVQRVSSASVSVDGVVVGAIGIGLLVLVAAAKADTEGDAKWLADRIAKMRIFNDAEGKMNLSLAEVDGGVLLVSNFTIYGDAVGGRRPSFIGAAGFEDGKTLFDRLCAAVRRLVPNVQMGEFGADMQVALVNDGPVTIIIESPLSDS